MTDKFMFFENMRQVIKSIPRDKQLELREAIEDYVFDGKEPEDWAFKAIIQSLKPSLEYKGRGAPTGNDNAKRGAIETKETTQNIENNSDELKQKKQFAGIETKKQETETETETETEISPPVVPPSGENTPKDKAKQKRFIPPTVEEVRSFAAEHGYGVDADRFVNFYASKGWVVGRSPMKDWRAAVRNWAADKKTATCSEQTGGIPFKSWREAARAQGVEV